MNKQQEPRLRFQGFAGAWEEKKIGEILSEVRRSIYLEDSEKYQLVTVKRRNEGVVSRGYLLGKDILVKNYSQLKTNDYLISKRQIIHGANGIVPSELDNAIVSNEYLVVVSNNDVRTEFLTLVSRTPSMYRKFLLSSYGVDIEKMVFNVEDWKSREITLPSLPEQTHLSLFFRRLDSQIAESRAVLEKSRQLKKAMLAKMFPANGEKIPKIRFKGFEGEWECRKLGEVASSYSGGTPSVGNSKFYGGNIPFIRSGEIHSSKTELFLTQEGLENSSAKLVKQGDILYALYGATSGEVERSKINGAINQAILAIIPNENYDVEFISQWLKNNKENIVNLYLQGGQGNLSGEIVKKIEISFPTKKEQNAIGLFFRQLDETIALQSAEIEKLNRLKKGLLAAMLM